VEEPKLFRYKKEGPEGGGESDGQSKKTKEKLGCPEGSALKEVCRLWFEEGEKT